MTRKPRPKRTYRTSLPSRADEPPPEGCDPSRRRFLRQIAAGTGALCFVGFAGNARSQERAVQFYRLEGHPETTSVEEGTGSIAPEPTDEPSVEVDPDPSVGAVVRVEENRALWVDPGYLILVRWTRPVGDNAPVAALEGAESVVEAFLASSVTSVDQLHNLDRLHRLEAELADILRRRVAPATIEVLHLDHDCSIVCGALSPGTGPPPPVHIDGLMPGPGWE